MDRSADGLTASVNYFYIIDIRIEIAPSRYGTID